jgi:hypothetical protein
MSHASEPVADRGQGRCRTLDVNKARRWQAVHHAGVKQGQGGLLMKSSEVKSKQSRASTEGKGEGVTAVLVPQWEVLVLLPVADSWHHFQSALKTHLVTQQTVVNKDAVQPVTNNLVN